MRHFAPRRPWAPLSDAGWEALALFVTRTAGTTGRSLRDPRARLDAMLRKALADRPWRDLSEWRDKPDPLRTVRRTSPFPPMDPRRPLAPPPRHVLGPRRPRPAARHGKTGSAASLAAPARAWPSSPISTVSACSPPRRWRRGSCPTPICPKPSSVTSTGCGPALRRAPTARPAVPARPRARHRRRPARVVQALRPAVTVAATPSRRAPAPAPAPPPRSGPACSARRPGCWPGRPRPAAAPPRSRPARRCGR
jgi:hypothetical protein